MGIGPYRDAQRTGAIQGYGTSDMGDMQGKYEYQNYAPQRLNRSTPVGIQWGYD